MIWQRKNKYDWISHLDDDDNDITKWFIIQRDGYGFMPLFGTVPGQARERWMTSLTTYPFKTFKGAETVCMIEYENLIAQ